MPKQILLALAVAALTLPTSPVLAHRPAPGGFAIQLAAEARISLEQAVARVQRATGGRVLDARAAGNGYRIKVLTREGEVRIVHVDGSTGAMR
jgi:uncharacterized membrane protein YkoI